MRLRVAMMIVSFAKYNLDSISIRSNNASTRAECVALTRGQSLKMIITEKPALRNPFFCHKRIVSCYLAVE